MKLFNGIQLFMLLFLQDAKKKICDDFVVDIETSQIKLELVNTNTSFGSTGMIIFTLFCINIFLIGLCRLAVVIVYEIRSTRTN